MTGPLHIALVVHSLGAGGAERVTANLAGAWLDAGHRVTLLTWSSEPDAYAVPGATRVRLDLATPSRHVLAGAVANVRRINALRRGLRAAAPDVAIGVMTTSNILLALASIRSGYRVVATEHTDPVVFPLGRLWSAVRRASYRWTDLVTAPTGPIADWLERNTRARTVRVLYNPVALPLAASGQQVAPVSVLPDVRPVVLGAGRLVPEKGFDRLIDAFAEIADEHADWDLVVVGAGPEHLALERRARERGLEGRVHLPGWAGNLSEWFERASLYVLSSRFEGFGNTIVEAMAHGCPVVAFDCPSGPAEIITNGVDGLLVADGDVRALAAEIDELMSSPDRRRELSARAAERVQRFTAARVLADWSDVFAEIGVRAR